MSDSREIVPIPSNAIVDLSAGYLDFVGKPLPSLSSARSAIAPLRMLPVLGGWYPENFTVGGGSLFVSSAASAVGASAIAHHSDAWYSSTINISARLYDRETFTTRSELQYTGQPSTSVSRNLSAGIEFEQTVARGAVFGIMSRLLRQRASSEILSFLSTASSINNLSTTALGVGFLILDFALREVRPHTSIYSFEPTSLAMDFALDGNRIACVLDSKNVHVMAYSQGEFKDDLFSVDEFKPALFEEWLNASKAMLQSSNHEGGHGALAP